MSVSGDGLFLATSVGEDAFLTYIPTERQISKIEGVCSTIFTVTIGYLTC